MSAGAPDTLHRWPQVPLYGASRRGVERPRWPAGVQHIERPQPVIDDAADRAEDEPEPIPAGEATDSDWGAFEDALSATTPESAR